MHSKIKAFTKNWLPSIIVGMFSIFAISELTEWYKTPFWFNAILAVLIMVGYTIDTRSFKSVASPTATCSHCGKKIITRAVESDTRTVG